MNRLLRMLTFSILLSLYITVIFILGRVAPIMVLLALLAWIIIRRPTAFQDHANADIKKFADRTAKTLQWLMEILIYPLVNTK